MESKFHKQSYRTKPEIIIGDMAKIIQEPKKLIEKYVARFRTVRTKCTIVMTEMDYVKLVQDGLLWPLKKHFLGTKFIDLYQLLSKVARYERVRNKSLE